MHPDGAHLIQHAQTLEDVEVARQQALADVEAGMRFLFHQDDMAACFGQESRSGGSGRPAADDEDIGLVGTGGGVAHTLEAPISGDLVRRI